MTVQKLIDTLTEMSLINDTLNRAYVLRSSVKDAFGIHVSSSDTHDNHCGNTANMLVDRFSFKGNPRGNESNDANIYHYFFYSNRVPFPTKKWLEPRYGYHQFVVFSLFGTDILVDSYDGWYDLRHQIIDRKKFNVQLRYALDNSLLQRKFMIKYFREEYPTKYPYNGLKIKRHFLDLSSIE